MSEIGKKLAGLGLYQRISSGGGAIVACVELSAEEILELSKQTPDQYGRVMIGDFRVTIKNGAVNYIIARVTLRDALIGENPLSAGHCTFSTSRTIVEISSEEDIKTALKLNGLFSEIAKDEILKIENDGSPTVVKTEKYLADNGIKTK